MNDSPPTYTDPPPAYSSRASRQEQWRLETGVARLVKACEDAKYLHAVVHETHEQEMAIACVNGNVRTVARLHELGASLPPLSTLNGIALKIAAPSSTVLEDMEWLSSVGATIPPDMFKHTGFLTNVEVAEFLVSVGQEPGPEALHSACRYGNLSLVKWYLARGVPFSWRKVKESVAAYNLNAGVLEHFMATYPDKCRSAQQDKCVIL